MACLLQNLSFMVPVGLLYLLVGDLLAGGGRHHPALYLAGMVVCVGLILLTTWFQYNATYFATYVESGVRRVTLAERLRKIPLSFFGKKDLADLTSHHHGRLHRTGDQNFSHSSVPGAGWLYRLHRAGRPQPVRPSTGGWLWPPLWVLPVSFAIVGLLRPGAGGASTRRSMDARMACADGIQECIVRPWPTCGPTTPRRPICRA